MATATPKAPKVVRNTFGVIHPQLLGEGKFAATDSQLEFLSNLLERHEMSQDACVTRFGAGGRKSGWQILDAFVSFDMQARHQQNESMLVSPGQRSYLDAFEAQAKATGNSEVLTGIAKLKSNIFASFGDYSRVLGNLAANFPLMTEEQIDRNLGIGRRTKDEEPF